MIINHRYIITRIIQNYQKKELLELIQKQNQLLAQKDEQLAEQKKVIKNSIPNPPKSEKRIEIKCVDLPGPHI